MAEKQASVMNEWIDEDEADQPEPTPRIQIMLVIFFVSLFAVSFPTVSRRIPGLRIPSIVFFVGKHFGTGVILSTAFVHLLQDAFASLQSPVVRAHWRIGNWTGLLVLGSLLSIFFVEYLSTSLVDRLYSYSSTPPTPRPEPIIPPILISSPPQKPKGDDHDTLESDEPPSETNGRPNMKYDTAPRPSCSDHSEPNERTPLRPTLVVDGARTPTRTQSYPRRSDRAPQSLVDGESQPESAFFTGGHHRYEGREAHASHQLGTMRSGWRSWFGQPESGPDVEEALNSERQETVEHGEEHSHEREHVHGNGHSHEHGHGHGHVHLDFEGDDWVNEDSPEVVRVESEGEVAQEIQVGRRRQIVGILMLQMGIMLHSLVIGLTLAITTGSEFASLVVAISFHQLFEGLSLGVRIAALPSTDSEGVPSVLGRSLKPALSAAFAVTTPVGIVIGLSAFSMGRSAGPKLVLIQGLMSAMSAGMLIYASCVEMLAGDFVMDPTMWRSAVWKQALALGSLVLGVAAMASLGI